MFCPKCGKMHQGNEKFCAECGHPFQINGNHEETVLVPKKSKLASLVLAIIAGVVVTVLIGYYGFTAFILSAKESNLVLDVSYQCMKKYNAPEYVKLSDIHIKLIGKEAAITGEYTQLDSGEKYNNTGANDAYSGRFIAHYDDIFFDDFPDDITLIDSGSED